MRTSDRSRKAGIRNPSRLRSISPLTASGKDGWKGDMPPVPSRWSAPGRQRVGEYLDEIEHLSLGTSLIGFTGDEPFISREHTRPRRASQGMHGWTQAKCRITLSLPSSRSDHDKSAPT